MTYITKYMKVTKNWPFWHFWHSPTNVNCNSWLDVKTSIFGVFINGFRYICRLLHSQIWRKNSLEKLTLYDFDEFSEVRITSCWCKVHIIFLSIGCISQPHFSFDISQILCRLLKRFTSWFWQILGNQDFHLRPCPLHWSTSSPPLQLTHRLQTVNT